MESKIERRGGRRSPPGGRPRSGRRHLKIWIREEILDYLGPDAAPIIRELVEETFKDVEPKKKHD